ncbi:tRNA (adenosine(37)-N6)-dimethylallyltransferase MiaA [Flavobacteriaceae bacterium S356]|uniref:tRNA dimethylallyltransferase n=1 Tax=Asprobacillus argus TaxID=3076534 RepID=A0ABU3LD56_9FLAO|nr:tRNA (adenosine(37)-N6)-dimethylallyltransferase MiaA [Flavobacteriaceae bacterium S356]
MATLITVVGPTAIGKTTLSIKLANHFDAPIISCDSRQFYTEMTIGTAVPNAEELAAAPHHFIQNRSISEDYNVGQFEKDALELLSELFKENAVVIMVGGSGLYVDAVLKGLDHFPDVDEKIRTQLTADLDQFGIEHLQKQLQELDPISYNTIAIENPQRLIRALEISIGTNIPFSTFKNKPKTPRSFHSIKVGINADRVIIYDRINKRVDRMMSEGLLDEVKGLLPYKNLNALQTVGYRELFLYLENKSTLEEAVQEIKKNTRRFAKRQLTWFKKDPEILWFDHLTKFKAIIKEIETKF